MERPPFSLPQAKSMIFICTQSHETIMFMEYQMQTFTVVLCWCLVITRGMHRFSATIRSFRSDILNWLIVWDKFVCMPHWAATCNSWTMFQLNQQDTTWWQHQSPPNKHIQWIPVLLKPTTYKVTKKCNNFPKLIANRFPIKLPALQSKRSLSFGGRRPQKSFNYTVKTNAGKLL